MATAIRKTSTVDEVFNVLQQGIVSGEFPEGYRFPPQNILADKYAVSRSTIREAINKLITLGHLSTKPGVGTTVINSSPSAYVAAMGQHMFLTSSEVCHFIEARLYLEKAAVKAAVLKATDEEIDVLGIIIQEQERAKASKNSLLFSELDASFHNQIITMSQNPVFIQFMDIIWDALSRFINEVSLLESAMNNALLYHNKILNALKSRDLYMSEKVIISHLKDVAQTIEKNVGHDIGLRTMFDMEAKYPSSDLNTRKNR